MRLAGLPLLLVVTACYRGDVPAQPASPAAPAPATRSACGPDDVVEPVIDLSPEGRLRSHVDGVLSGPGGRTWIGPAVPDAIPTQLGTLELFVLDRADGGYLALYREPYGLASCQLGTDDNCAYEVRHYDRRGQLRWALPMDGVLSRPDHLEIQDLRLAGGVLYFNEACQSYARDAGGACSALVAYDPRAREVLWRTPPLVSNGRFVVRGCYLITGYGFTAELDAVKLVDRATGRVRQTVLVSSAPERYRLDEPGLLDVTLYSGATRTYRLDGIDGPAGRLVDLGAPEPGYGGSAYGGAAYGGSAYGGSAYGGAAVPRPPRP